MANHLCRGGTEGALDLWDCCVAVRAVAQEVGKQGSLGMGDHS